MGPRKIEKELKERLNKELGEVFENKSELENDNVDRKI
jgi:hypothetical protein